MLERQLDEAQVLDVDVLCLQLPVQLENVVILRGLEVLDAPDLALEALVLGTQLPFVLLLHLQLVLERRYARDQGLPLEVEGLLTVADLAVGARVRGLVGIHPVDLLHEVELVVQLVHLQLQLSDGLLQLVGVLLGVEELGSLRLQQDLLRGQLLLAQLVLGEQGLELVVHLLQDAFILHYCEGELGDRLLLLVVLHSVQAWRATGTVRDEALELAWLLKKLSLQLLQLFVAQAVQELLWVVWVAGLLEAARVQEQVLVRGLR